MIYLSCWINFTCPIFFGFNLEERGHRNRRMILQNCCNRRLEKQPLWHIAYWQMRWTSMNDTEWKLILVWQERTPALFVIPEVQRPANHSASTFVHKLVVTYHFCPAQAPPTAATAWKLKREISPDGSFGFCLEIQTRYENWSAKWSCVRTPWGQRGEKKDLLFVDGWL